MEKNGKEIEEKKDLKERGEENLKSELTTQKRFFLPDFIDDIRTV